MLHDWFFSWHMRMTVVKLFRIRRSSCLYIFFLVSIRSLWHTSFYCIEADIRNEVFCIYEGGSEFSITAVIRLRALNTPLFGQRRYPFTSASTWKCADLKEAGAQVLDSMTHLCKKLFAGYATPRAQLARPLSSSNCNGIDTTTTNTALFKNNQCRAHSVFETVPLGSEVSELCHLINVYMLRCLSGRGSWFFRYSILDCPNSKRSTCIKPNNILN